MDPRQLAETASALGITVEQLLAEHTATRQQHRGRVAPGAGGGGGGGGGPPPVWRCPSCTLINEEGVAQCKACNMPRGANLASWHQAVKAAAGGGGAARPLLAAPRAAGGGGGGAAAAVAPLWPAPAAAGPGAAGGGAPPAQAVRHQNDEGFEMKFGEGGILYCGRNLGKAAIPGSDGVCGPHDGPQCNSCKRYLIPALPGTKVYAVLGHGCDITSIERQPIPAGSYYITVEECGGVSADLPKILYGFNDARVNSRDIRLLDGNRSFENMVNYFSIGLPAARPFKVRGPGRNHTAGLNSLFAQLDMTHMGGCIIVKSGLYEMGNVPYINNIPGKIYMTFPNIDDPRVPRGSIIILRSDLEEIYRGSLYFPDYDYIFGGFPAKIVTLNNLNTAIARSFLIKYGDLDAFNHKYSGMYKVINNREKGIIYNLACRVDCNNDMQSAARAMMASRKNNGYGAMNRGVGAGPIFNNVMFDYIDKWAIQVNLIRGGERGGIRGGAYEQEGPARLLPGLLPRLSGGSQRRKNTRKDRRRRKIKRKNRTKRVRS